MVGQRRTLSVLVILIVALALVAGLLVGCGKNPGAGAKVGSTALDNLSVARSALSTVAPDAKLLVARLATDTVPGAAEVWGYYFGSPATDEGYFVHLANGLSMGWQDDGRVGLTPGEWAAVPGTDAWKVDSDVAYAKAVAASGLSTSPAGYMMGLETYKFSDDTSTVEPFVWRVLLYPAASAEATIHVDVNATTGAAVVRK
jgi:hypothetical protein